MIYIIFLQIKMLYIRTRDRLINKTLIPYQITIYIKETFQPNSLNCEVKFQDMIYIIF